MTLTNGANEKNINGVNHKRELEELRGEMKEKSIQFS